MTRPLQFRPAPVASETPIRWEGDLTEWSAGSPWGRCQCAPLPGEWECDNDANGLDGLCTLCRQHNDHD